jgi:hypothetical protein
VLTLTQGAAALAVPPRRIRQKQNHQHGERHHHSRSKLYGSVDSSCCSRHVRLHGQQHT